MAIIRWARAIATCGLCAWWTLACGAAATAVTPVSDTVPGYNGPRLAVPGPMPVIPGPAMVPCTDPCPCIPNVRAFGVYQTRWREWPDQARPDKTFPASINKEVLPVPPGQEPIPVPKGTLIPPGGASESRPGTKEAGPGTGGLKIDGLLPGGGLRGLEEPSEQPKTTTPLPGVEGTLPGLPGVPTPKAGAKEAPALEPPAAPKSGDEGSNLRPRGVPPFDPMQRRLLPKPEEEKVLADWSRVLDPGFRGDADRPRLTQSSTPPTRGQLNAGPVRQAAHQATDVPGRSAVQRPVFEQTVGQPSGVAPALWRPESRVAMLDGYCPVDLGKNERWSKGDPSLSETYQSMTFHFSSAMQRECFLADPERYVPAYSGSDAVLLIDGNRTVPGKVDFCVTYDGRLYMFSSAESLTKFRQEPKRYTLTGR